MDDADLPIGLFDSGFGGLTVMREIAKALPRERLIYLGDTARLPYGNKSPESIRSFSLDNALFLLEKKIKLLIVACNTACSHSLELLQKSLPIPVIGVIEPGFKALLKTTKTKRAAILATEGTIHSHVFQKLLEKHNPSIQVYPIACPLFVPLVEEGLHEHPAADMIANHYLKALNGSGIDTALLACTHYPLLKETIQRAIGPQVTLIEPAEACAREAKALLESLRLTSASPQTEYSFYASDDPEKFRKLGKFFFPLPIDHVILRPIGSFCNTNP